MRGVQTNNNSFNVCWLFLKKSYKGSNDPSDFTDCVQ